MNTHLVSLFMILEIFTVAVGHAQSNTSPTKVTGKPTSTASGLQYWDIVVGTGDTAVAGKPVKVHYTGWLIDGKKFDSSLDRGQPFSFPLGGGKVIKGWDEGVGGMKVGGKRQLRIPPGRSSHLTHQLKSPYSRAKRLPRKRDRRRNCRNSGSVAREILRACWLACARPYDE